jgi:site-specific DNA-methyltransferase (adenine-specific)
MNHLYYGDNLNVLRDLPGEHVDLIYLDPPFNSNAGYNQLFKSPDGSGSTAQIEAFNDTWHWGDTAEEAYQAVRRSPNAAAAQMLSAMRGFLGENDMMAYLAMMAVRLIELHRVLKPTGSLYLHCDPTASHYLKIMLDAVFGKGSFRNEVVWRRSVTKGDARKKFSDDSDTILFYTKSNNYTFFSVYVDGDEEYIKRFNQDDNDGRGPYHLAPLDSPNPRPNLMYEYKGYPHPPKGWRVSREEMQRLDEEGRIWFPTDTSGRLRRKLFLKDQQGPKVGSVWIDIRPLQGMIGSNTKTERLGYPTQKPVALLERILNASSNPGDIVLDPFCGCGTTVHAAEKLGRKWIGIDVTHLAIGLIEKRLRDAFPNVQFTTHGVPQDIHAARDLANRGRDNGNYYFEFEKWALSLLDAQPGNLSKKGADKGIDGNLWFGKTGRAIISVKAGDNVGVAMVRDLRGVIEREKADLGVLLTLTPPKSTMIAEAAAAGQHVEPGFTPVPRLQIVTIEDAMALRERAVQLPARRADTFRRAPREEDRSAQGRLEL